MDIRLDGKVGLVTGGSRGIGLEIAKLMVESGAKVMIVSRKLDSLKQAAQEIDPTGESVATFAANTGDPEAGRAAVEAVLLRFSSLDLLVNNAATNPYFGQLMDIDESRASKTVQVNQEGVLAWTQACWHGFMRENGGVVLNMASVGGLSVEWGIGYYNVTKAAVIHMTRQMAGEMGPKVRVNAIAPGLIRTAFAKALWETNEEAVAKRLPLRRIGEPSDIAKTAVFLLSDASGWTTGATLEVDGGALVVPSGGIT
ncbi:MAG: SDR family oxidoreductase [Acidimicrobiales bacterium]|nr:SDR family oxidoreductase [Acidimicrobiales bacterium]